LLLVDARKDLNPISTLSGIDRRLDVMEAALPQQCRALLVLG